MSRPQPLAESAIGTIGLRIGNNAVAFLVARLPYVVNLERRDGAVEVFGAFTRCGDAENAARALEDGFNSNGFAPATIRVHELTDVGGSIRDEVRWATTTRDAYASPEAR